MTTVLVASSMTFHVPSDGDVIDMVTVSGEQLECLRAMNNGESPYDVMAEGESLNVFLRRVIDPMLSRGLVFKAPFSRPAITTHGRATVAVADAEHFDAARSNASFSASGSESAESDSCAGPKPMCSEISSGTARKCCQRAGEYNGFASGPLEFVCPEHCACHD